MVSFNSLSIAAAISTLFLGTHAGPLLAERWAPELPACTNTTDFVYAGCFIDPSSPSALLFRTNINSQNMTVEICVDFCKGNGYKYAGLEYYGECFCGASVGGPQTAESNCSFPCTGNNNESCGGNDIISVYQDTTFPTVDDTTIADYKPMGCYSDLGPNGRTLAWKQDQIPNADLTIESCLHACKEGGYAFAGVEYSQECYCGVVLGNGTAKVDESNCQMTCNGNTAELCGGAANIYLYVAEDLLSTDPCNGNPGGSVSSSSISTYSSTSSSTSSAASSTIYTTTSSTLSSSSSSYPSSSSTDTSSTAAASTPYYTPPVYSPPPYTPPPYTPPPYTPPAYTSPASSSSFYSSPSSAPSSSSSSTSVPSAPASSSSSLPSAPPSTTSSTSGPTFPTSSSSTISSTISSISSSSSIPQPPTSTSSSSTISSSSLTSSTTPISPPTTTKSSSTYNPPSSTSTATSTTPIPSTSSFVKPSTTPIPTPTTSKPAQPFVHPLSLSPQLQLVNTKSETGVQIPSHHLPIKNPVPQPQTHVSSN